MAPNGRHYMVGGVSSGTFVGDTVWSSRRATSTQYLMKVPLGSLNSSDPYGITNFAGATLNNIDAWFPNSSFSPVTSLNPRLFIWSGQFWIDLGTFQSTSGGYLSSGLGTPAADGNIYLLVRAPPQPFFNSFTLDQLQLNVHFQ